jgi:hypothetical protein
VFPQTDFESDTNRMPKVVILEKIIVKVTSSLIE